MTGVGEVMNKKELCPIDGGNANWCSPSGRMYGESVNKSGITGGGGKQWHTWLNAHNPVLKDSGSSPWSPSGGGKF